MPEHVMEIDEHMGSAELVVRHKTTVGRCTIQLCGNADEFWVQNSRGRCLATFSMTSDPVRGAEVKGRERFNAAASAVLDSSTYQKLQDALDAPEPPTSEFERGGAATRRLMLDTVRRWEGAALTTERFRHMVLALEALKEPAR